jgi:enamine deaminase RidA (YjgF/YER057c/UK114 family)
MLKRNYITIESLDQTNALTDSLSADFQAGILIGVTAFVDASSDEKFFQKRNFILAFFDRYFNQVPVGVVAQSTGDGVIFEIWTNTNGINREYKQECGVNYTVYEDETGKSVWAFGCTAASCTLSFDEQTRHSFDAMQAILSKENMSMDNLVRQWNYIPSLLVKTSHTMSQQQFQRYQLFNELRQEYYAQYKNDKNYPAATGIGMAYGAVTIDFAALKPSKNTLVVGLNNPNQTDAYRYGQEVLIGSAFASDKQKRPPLFERAKYVGKPKQQEIIFVSGTAAIVGEKTVALNDVVRQTLTTMKNISALIEPQNLTAKHIPANQTSYTYLRVYVKNEKHRNLVRKICKNYYPHIPVLCIQADICRDDLLVEIEGEATVYS